MIIHTSWSYTAIYVDCLYHYLCWWCYWCYYVGGSCRLHSQRLPECGGQVPGCAHTGGLCSGAASDVPWLRAADREARRTTWSDRASSQGCLRIYRRGQCRDGTGYRDPEVHPLQAVLYSHHRHHHHRYHHRHRRSESQGSILTRGYYTHWYIEQLDITSMHPRRCTLQQASEYIS